MSQKTDPYLYDSDPEIELMDHFVQFMHHDAEQNERKVEKKEGNTIVNFL